MQIVYEYLERNCHYIISKPAQDKSYNKMCATSKDSDQPVHPHYLIKVFADHICLLQPPGYLKMDKQKSLPYWMHEQADLSWLVTQPSGQTTLK